MPSKSFAFHANNITSTYKSTMCPPASGTSFRKGLSATLELEHIIPLIPDTQLSRAALTSVAHHLPVPILNHSVRTYVYAEQLAKRELFPLTPRARDLLFVAAIHHDLGATMQFNGDERFEVEGADAAVAFLRSAAAIDGVAREDELHHVWLAIAMHTSGGIAERVEGLTRFIRLGVLVDFMPAKKQELAMVSCGENAEARLPRLNIEKILSDTVVAQALKRAVKAPPASWPGVLLRAYNEDPDWDGVNKAF